MAKRTLEDVLVANLRQLNAGEPVSAPQADEAPDGTPWLRLHGRLAISPQQDASAHGRSRGRERMLAALATRRTAGGLRMIPSLSALVPKAAMLVIGGFVLTGSAVGATAAVGGPNLPSAALNAIGLHAGVLGGVDIDDAPDARPGGEEHANENVANGSANASVDVQATVTGTAGINNAPESAQTGTEHANEHAFLGAGNASAEATETAGVRLDLGDAGDGLSNPNDHADEHALLGAENASVETATTVTLEGAVGIGYAPNDADGGIGHAATNASLAAGGASAADLETGIAEVPGAAQVGIEHATAGSVSFGIVEP